MFVHRFWSALLPDRAQSDERERRRHDAHDKGLSAERPHRHPHVDQRERLPSQHAHLSGMGLPERHLAREGNPRAAGGGDKHDTLGVQTRDDDEELGEMLRHAHLDEFAELLDKAIKPTSKESKQ